MELCITRTTAALLLLRRFRAAAAINRALRQIHSFTEGSVPAKEDADQLAARLLDTYGNSVLRLAYSYLHNMSDSEDVLQDTLIKYLDSGFVPESASHEKAYLLRAAANISKNKIDYNRLRQCDELEETLIAQEREDLSFVWEAVKKLPDSFREAIHLFYYEGYSTREISKILRRNENSVRSDLSRGRAKLKEILKEAYDLE